MKQGKTIIDPVYGFVHVPAGLLLQLLEHPLVRRLSRIKQLGLVDEVYPGARHTRFEHSLGAYHLMTEALRELRQKGFAVSATDDVAARAAMLLHDIGHGPFSHVLEPVLFGSVRHEQISLAMMRRLARELGDECLLRAIELFKGTGGPPFLHELIASQLDTDRLDYLGRDSLFTGVREGSIGTERILGLLGVADGRLVVMGKGLYSIENYLVTRRLMYWQVYLHKTAIAAWTVVANALQRARRLLADGKKVEASPALTYFLTHEPTAADFEHNPECMARFAELDDADVMSALKTWQHSSDRVLSVLATDYVDRRLFRVETSDNPPAPEHVEQMRTMIAERMKLTPDEATWLTGCREIKKWIYSPRTDAIHLLLSDGSVRPMTEVSDIIRHDNTREANRCFYFCYHRC